MLRDEAMIVRLSIKQWTARKFDKGISEKIAGEYGAEADAGRYNKVLIAKEAIQDVNRAAGAAREYHYKVTLPWDDSGSRILPTAMFMEYSKNMRDLHGKFDQAVREFIDNYDEYRDEARVRLNGMFKAEDYPGRSEIEGRYSYSTDIEPVPSGDDFRVALQSKDAARLKKELEARVNDRVKNATEDLYGRLAGVVGNLAERLSIEKGVFRDSLVGNVVELIELLPKLNIAGDPKLEKLRKEVESKLTAHEPETLRKDKDIRAAVSKDAQAILDKMSAYMKR